MLGNKYDAAPVRTTLIDLIYYTIVLLESALLRDTGWTMPNLGDGLSADLHHLNYL